MDRLIKEHFTGYLHRIDPKDIRGKEVWFWFVLVLNLCTFFINVFSGSFFFLFSVVGVGVMMYAINSYYRYER